jgi:hypothetical protein
MILSNDGDFAFCANAVVNGAIVIVKRAKKTFLKLTTRMQTSKTQTQKIPSIEAYQLHTAVDSCPQRFF